MRVPVPLIVFAMFVAMLAAGLGLYLWLDPSHAAKQVVAAPPQASDTSRASASSNDALSTQVAALEARVKSLEDELRVARETAQRIPAPPTSSESPTLTPEQFAERYREPIAKLIDESRHDQAWLKEQDDIYSAACGLTYMGMPEYKGDQARDELRVLLVREFKPVFDLQWRLDDAHADPKIAAELSEPLKIALRAFYRALSARYSVDFSDRAFARLALPKQIARDAIELRANVESALR